MGEKLTYTQEKRQQEAEVKKKNREKMKKYTSIFLWILMVFFLAKFSLWFFISEEKEFLWGTQDTQKKVSGIIIHRKKDVDYDSIYLTRWELVSILVLYLWEDISDINDENCFRDIENSQFQKEICYALKKWWIQGKNDGFFYPNDIINHAQWLKLILNFLGENVPQKAYENTYKDIDRSLWYATYAEYAKRKGIIDEQVDYFYPEESISLEQVDQYVLKTKQLQEK